MKIIEDLGLRLHGNRNRRFILVECPACGGKEEIRSDSKIQHNTSCRLCKGFTPMHNNFKTCKRIHTTEEFVKQCSDIHSYKYTYANTVFEKSSLKVAVTCQHHGDFLITPNNHQRGKGCPKCAANKRGWNRSLYLGKPTSLYYACINNKYFKIGISKQGERHRFYKDRAYGNAVKIIFEVWFFDGADAYDLEKEVLLLVKDIKANKDVLVHGGNTEVHTENILRKVEKLVILKNIKEINA